jgi:two-component system, chemotaxis family, chemotaxis protein CheY
MNPQTASRPVATVLVADHDVDTRTMYCDALSARGYDVAEASDGRDALVRALLTAPGVVVARQSLPLLDGDTLCQLLRRDRTTATARIMIVTDDMRPAAAVRAARAGADVVLALPVSPDDMVDAIDTLLDAGLDSAIAGGDDRAPGDDRLERRLSKTHARFMTTTPPAHPPELRCPSCDAALTYRYSYVGGVNRGNAEQWDCYVCLGSASCGAFEYRHRTRKLRIAT